MPLKLRHKLILQAQVASETAASKVIVSQGEMCCEKATSPVGRLDETSVGAVGASPPPAGWKLGSEHPEVGITTSGAGRLMSGDGPACADTRVTPA